MSDLIIPQNFGQVSTRFQQSPVEDDLSSGIQSSFGIIGYKGKVWSIRYRGDELQLMREDGDGPKSSIEVVLLKSSKNISKVWYEQGYVEGSNAAPDCFSNNGVSPEATSLKKQSNSCALCPHNQWGSRITPAGKQGKACSDSKRVAVAPLNDIANEMFGGPMLLRVPAASLQDLAMYGQKMQQMGYPYYAIGTRIQFDPTESFPKFKITAMRPLSDEEADIVLAIREGHTVERILSENEFAAVAPGEPVADTPESVFEQPPVKEAAKAPAKEATKTIAGDVAKAAAATATKAAAKKVTTQGNTGAATGFGGAVKKAEPAQTVAEPDPEMVSQTVTESDEDREERELLEQMAALKAKKAAAAKAALVAAAAAEAQHAETASAEVVEDAPDDTGNMASSFEADLDSMLSELLPAN